FGPCLAAVDRHHELWRGEPNRRLHLRIDWFRRLHVRKANESLGTDISRSRAHDLSLLRQQRRCSLGRGSCRFGIPLVRAKLIGKFRDNVKAEPAFTRSATQAWTPQTLFSNLARDVGRTGENYSRRHRDLGDRKKIEPGMAVASEESGIP